MSPRSQGAVAWLLLLLLLAGCDDPPSAPEPNIDIDQQQQELRQEVEETRREASERVDQAAGQIPDDTGSPDASSPNADQP